MNANKIGLLLLAFSLLVIETCQAALTVSGFLSQGLMQNSDANFSSRSSDYSAKLTELGLNAAYQYSPTLRLAGQVVYIDNGNRNDSGLKLDFLFLDWAISNDVDSQLNLHLGRTKSYHWFYSATRDVPHTRPSIVLPQSVYFDAFRDAVVGSDGLTLRYNRSLENGLLEGNWSIGKAYFSKQQSQMLLTPLSTGRIEQKYVQQASVFFTANNLPLVLGLSGLDTEYDYHQGENDLLQTGQASTRRTTLHAQMFSERITITSELFREKVGFDNVFYPGFTSVNQGEGGYVQFQYRFNENLEFLLRADKMVLDRNDRNGNKLATTSQGLIPAHSGYMTQKTLGLGWTIKPNLKLNIEYHQIEGTARLAPVLIPDTIHNQKDWSITALQLMYWF